MDSRPGGYPRRTMETARELSLREKIRQALIDEVPEASNESAGKALNRIRPSWIRLTVRQRTS